MPRPQRNLRLVRPWVEPVDPPHSPTLRQKSNHLMQTANHFLPPWLQRYQHGSSTNVKSYFLLPILGWAVKTCHCTCHAEHCSTTDPLRGEIRRVSYPEIPEARSYPFSIDPPRPRLDQPPVNKEARPARHKTRGLFTIPSFTSPWCPGMANHSRSTSLQRLPQRSIKLYF
jgi:hypothetical protein